MAVNLKKKRTIGLISLGSLGTFAAIIGIASDLGFFKLFAPKDDNSSQSSIVTTVTANNIGIDEPESKETTAQTETEPVTTTTAATEPEVIGSVPLMEPYDGDKYYFEIVDKAKIAGIEYKNVPTICAYENSFMVYNLGGKYSSLEFDFGHIDGSSTSEEICGFAIYLGEDENQIIEIKPSDYPTHVKIDNISECNYLKIICCQEEKYSRGPRFGVVNGTLYP